MCTDTAKGATSAGNVNRKAGKDEETYRRLRLLNNLASARSRLRRKMKITALFEEEKALEEKRVVLVQELEKWQLRKRKMVFLLRRHRDCMNVYKKDVKNMPSL